MTKKEFDNYFSLKRIVQDKQEVEQLIFKVLNPLQPKLILEIGLEGGSTSNIWRHYCKRLDGLFIGVDTVVSHAKDFLTINGYDFHTKLIQGRSQDPNIINEVRDSIEGKFDFIYLDGAHELDQVYLDIKNYYPMLRYEGVMALHDANKAGPGPYRAIQQAKSDGIVNFSEEKLIAGKMGTFWGKKK